MTSTSATVVVAVCATVCIGYVGANNSCPSSFPSSCEALYDDLCESGYYAIAGRKNSILSVYCTTEVLCGSTGWTRIGIANYSDPATECPLGFIEYNDGGVRASVLPF